MRNMTNRNSLPGRSRPREKLIQGGDHRPRILASRASGVIVSGHGEGEADAR